MKTALIGALIGATAYLAFAFFGPAPNPETPDFRSFYSPVAESVLEGRGLSTDSGDLATRYPPGYPLTLAGLNRFADFVGFPRFHVLFVFRLLCASLTAALIAATAALVVPGGPPLVAAAAWAVYPPGLWLSSLNLSENVFIPLLLGSFYCLIRGVFSDKPRWWMGSGALVGLAMLFRPIVIGLSPIMALTGWLISRRFSSQRAGGYLGAVTMMLVTVLIVAPWELRVMAETGKIIPLSTGGTPTIHDGLTWAIRDKGFRTHQQPSEALHHAMLKIEESYKKDPSTEALLKEFGSQVVVNPQGVVSLLSLKAIRSWYGTDSGRNEPALAAVQVVWLAGILLALSRAPAAGNQAKTLAILAITIGLYFWAMTVIGLSIARYTVPAIAVLATCTPILVSPRIGSESES